MATTEVKTRGSKQAAILGFAGNENEEYPAAAAVQITRLQWLPGAGHICRGWIVKESDDAYSAVSSNLPGVASQGDSPEDAKANLAEAFRAALEEYLAAGMPIPWKSPSCDERPMNAVEAWIAVNA